MLCSNRPEGFSGHSSISSPIPTTCFVDVVLIPLPVWIGLALVPVLFVAKDCAPSTAYFRFSRTGWVYRVISGIYYVLIICNILMQTLEIVRLSLIHFGIGLLPFSYVGLILAAALHWSPGVRFKIQCWQAVNMVIWVGGAVMAVVKAIGLGKEGINGREGSKYPISDQVIDVAVIAGVYAALALLEVILEVWRHRERSSRK